MSSRDIDRLRLRPGDGIPAFECPDSGARSFVGQVFGNPTVPTRTGVFYSVHPVTVSGDETEGGAASIAVDSSVTIVVFVLGSKAPVAGDLLVCTALGSRWFAERMTHRDHPAVSLPGCPCTDIPTTLHMVSSDHASNFAIFQDATFVRSVPDPAYAALALGAHAWISAESFPDSSTGDLFQYYFACVSTFYIITRIYKASFYGTPYMDVVRYRWAIGISGNACSPFGLNNGVRFVGATPVTVTINP